MFDTRTKIYLVGGLLQRSQRLLLYGGTGLRIPSERHRFAQLHANCMFVGYPRSSHSLIGALLNAHPVMVISHELNALRYFGGGFSPTQIFQLIVRSAEQFTERGSEWTGYSMRSRGSTRVATGSCG